MQINTPQIVPQFRTESIRLGGLNLGYNLGQVAGGPPIMTSYRSASADPLPLVASRILIAPSDVR